MECKIIKIISALFIVGLLLLSSCYYDNYDDLAVAGIVCDTVSMKYSVDIVPIMDNSCVSCHSGSVPAGNIDLSTYSNVKVYADGGSLLGSIAHENGYSSMPKNQNMLDDCTISKVLAWINQGSKY